MMWETLRRENQSAGRRASTWAAGVIRCEYDDANGTLDDNLSRPATGTNTRSIRACHFLGADARTDQRSRSPPFPKQQSARPIRCKYRDFLTVMLILKNRDAFHDNWIYIHDPSVKVGRIQNFRSWSPEMVPDPDKACYGLEYFCFEDDGLWDSKDEDLIALAKRELDQIGLAREGDVLDGCVVRQKKAYPVYDDDYADHVATIRDELDSRYPNLHLVGRNGMHKYNNQDHAMMTAMLCAENIIANTKLYDLWHVNQDAEYHEAGDAPAEETVGTAIRLVPTRVTGYP